VSFVTITLHVASQLVFIVVSLYFIIDSVRKLLDNPPICLGGGEYRIKLNLCVCVCLVEIILYRYTRRLNSVYRWY
jgi:hypothetical protein